MFESVHFDKLYHGNRKGDFPPEHKRFAGAIFLTTNLDFAKDFAGFDDKEMFPDGAVWQVTLKQGLKICDPSKKESMLELDLGTLINEMISKNYVDKVNETKFKKVGAGFKGYDPSKDAEFDLEKDEQSVYHYLWRIKNGSWRIIECEPIIERIKQKGYDGFQVFERGTGNVAVFDEKSISKFTKIS